MLNLNTFYYKRGMELCEYINTEKKHEKRYKDPSVLELCKRNTLL